MVYDPDSGLDTDIVASEDARQSERATVAPLLASGGPGQLWIADRHVCTRMIMQDWNEAKGDFIVREYTRRPQLVTRKEWSERGSIGDRLGVTSC